MGAATTIDLGLIGLAGLGMVGWAISSEPVVTTLFVVTADMIGVVMMLPKTWRDPWSETTPTFVLASASGVCGAVSVGEIDASLLLYPSYFAVGNGAIAGVIAPPPPPSVASAPKTPCNQVGSRRGQHLS